LKTLFLILILFAIIFTGFIPLQNAFAQGDILTEGIKDNTGSWWVGEGLKKGDQFSYRMCHVDFRECSDFEMNIWIEGDISVGTETKWLVQTVVYDRIYVIPGTMELGKIAPEPTGGSAELSKYRGAFKTSIVWLSAFANAHEPKEFSRPSWGKIANIGGQQIIPQEMQIITVPGGTFETALIAWRTGGETSRVWVVDEFPFPIKAETFTHVSSGIPPPEYQFQLLDYKENVQTNPFAGIEAKLPDVVKEGCPQNYDLVDVKRSTKNFAHLLEVKYGPENPLSGCEIEWFINFKKVYNPTEFLNQVQYDILVVDENLTPIRSIAGEEGSGFLYSPSGQVHRNTIVTENGGISHYVIWIYGLAPKNIVPSSAPDYLQIDIPISGKIPVSSGPGLAIPDWIKNNARWWAGGQIGDSDFVTGIQFLINQDIMKIPPTAQGTGSGSDEIPGWIKNNAGWWADGLITDNDFVQGIQFLIENGIMKIG